MPKWFGGSALNPDIVEEKDHWRIQWNRVLRWHSRVQALAQKSNTSELSNFDNDDIITYFQNCYHFKDHLENSCKDLKEPIKDLFKENIELKFCRDIANGFKHKTISRASLDSDFNWYCEYDYFETNKNPIKYRAAFEEPKKKEIVKFEVFDLCDKCLEIWQKFLTEHHSKI